MLPIGFISDTNGNLIWNPQGYAKATWDGNAINGYAWGKGNLTWYDEQDRIVATYEGQMRQGRYHGKGNLLCMLGNRSFGDWIEGAFQGKVATRANALRNLLQKLKLA